jgi:excisionase family DNA binding protein
MYGSEMNALPITKQPAQAPLLVSASAIAKDLSVTARYVHLLAEQGKIPVVRFGRRCIRFSKPDVFRALGINTEAASGASR